MLKRAYIAAQLIDASIVKGLLESKGLNPVLKGEYAWIARGETPLTQDTAPAIWVPEEELDEAHELIDEYENPSRYAPRACPSCGEILEGQFTQCWRCGAFIDEENE